MLTSKSVITAGGRIIIPANIRKYLNLHEGEEVLLKADSGELHITTTKKNIETAQALVRKYNRNKVALSKVLLAERKEENEDE